MVKHLGSILWGKRFGLFTERCLSRWIEIWGSRGRGGDGNANGGEELFLSCGRADAEQARGMSALILKLMRRVGWYVSGDAAGGC